MKRISCQYEFNLEYVKQANLHQEDFFENFVKPEIVKSLLKTIMEEELIEFQQTTINKPHQGELLKIEADFFVMSNSDFQEMIRIFKNFHYWKSQQSTGTILYSSVAMDFIEKLQNLIKKE